MEFRVIVVSEGPWGAAVGQHLFGHAPPEWAVRHLPAEEVGSMGVWGYGGMEERGPSDTPTLPPPTDLLVALCEGGGLTEALPELIASLRPAAVLAPVEESTWFPPPTRKRLAAFCQSQDLPCSLPGPF